MHEWCWDSIGRLRVRRQGLACAALHDSVYAIGGYDGASNLRSNPTSDTRTPTPKPYDGSGNRRCAEAFPLETPQATSQGLRLTG